MGRIIDEIIDLMFIGMFGGLAVASLILLFIALPVYQLFQEVVVCLISCVSQLISYF